MSTEAVNQFLEKVAQDNQLQEELAKAMEAENDRQAVTELANSKGYQFTGEELMAEIEKRQQAAIDSGEISEEELESVSGGATPSAVIATLAWTTSSLAVGGGVLAIKWTAKW